MSQTQVPGRVGDACVAGGASYADSTVGGCGSTGDGDLHLRFQPCYQVTASSYYGCEALPNNKQDVSVML